MNLFYKIRKKIKFYWMRKKRYSTWCASAWIKAIENEDNGSEFSISERRWAHKKGFLASHKKLFGLNKENYTHYMSDLEYLSLHPINGFYSRWIDDKVTLKYIFSGIGLGKIIPKYYFTIDDGQALKMIDCPKELQSSIDGILNLLKEKNVLALKKMIGTLGDGFYRLENLVGAEYNLNGKNITEGELLDHLRSLKNYIVTEYIYPCQEMARIYSKTPNTIRYVAYRDRNKLKFLMGLVKFGVNSSCAIDHFHAGGVLCYLDKKGHYDGGLIMDLKEKKGVKKVQYHPDSGKKLKGRIPMWDSVEEVVRKVEEKLPQLKYLGFDFVLSSEGVRILEINSLPGLGSIQMKESLLKDPEIRMFFKRLKK